MMTRYDICNWSAITKAADPMIGGTICPPVEAVASTPPANVGENPLRLMSGMVRTPVPTTLATGTPDMVPNRLEARTAAWAGPPRVRRVAAKAARMSDSPTPVASSSAPKIINGKTVKITISKICPRTPLLRLNQRSSEKLSTKDIGMILKIHGRY